MNLMELFVKVGVKDEASKDVSNISDKLKKGIGTAAKVAGAAVAAAGTGIAAFAKSSVEAGRKFDESMSQVAATMGKTTDEVKDLRDFALEMGSKTAFSASQAADALNYMALAGYDSATSMKMLPNVLNLAAAGNIELAQASDMVTDAQSALGLSLDDTSKMVDKMAKASSKSNTSVAQLGEAFLTVGGTAKTLKGGTTELSTALGLLADNGIKGAEGGTALRNILLALNPTTDKAIDTFKQLNLSAYDSNGNMRNLKDVFGDLNKAMEPMTEQEKQNVLSSIFNKVDLKSVNALLATNANRWDELTGAIDDSAGAAQKMADTQLDNLEGKLTLFKSAVEGAKISLSDKLVPTLTDMIEKITKFVSDGGIDKMVNGFINLSPAIASAVTAVTTFKAAMTISKMIDTVSKAIAAYKAANEGATIAQWAMNAAMNANPIVLIVTLIAALIAGIITLWTTNEDFRNAIIKAWEEIKEFAVNVFGAIADFFTKTIPNAITGLWETIKNFFTVKIPEAFSTFLGFVKELPEKVAYWFGYMVGRIISFLIELPSKVADIFKSIWDWAIEAIPNFILTVVNFYKELPIKIWNLLKKIVTSVADWGKNMISSVKENVPKIISKVVEFFSQLPDKIKGIGKNIVEGLWKGIQGAWKWLTDKVSGIFNGLVKGVKDGLGIHSPSRVFAGIGKNMALGVGEGWDDTFGRIEKNINNSMNFDDADFGITTATATSGVLGGASSVPASAKTEVVISVDDSQNLMGFARALLPLLKVAEKEAFA